MRKAIHLYMSIMSSLGGGGIGPQGITKDDLPDYNGRTVPFYAPPDGSLGVAEKTAFSDGWTAEVVRVERLEQKRNEPPMARYDIRLSGPRKKVKATHFPVTNTYIWIR